MSSETVSYRPIGAIRSGHARPEQTPIQPVYAQGCRGRAEILPEYVEGLRDLDGFSHVFLLYHFDRAAPVKLMVKPFLQDIERGVFATRAPCRPNTIGLSIVQLLRRDGNILYLDGVDILDGTPLLDIKPYVSRFDCIEQTRNGWQDDVDEKTARERGHRGAQAIHDERQGATGREEKTGESCADQIHFTLSDASGKLAFSAFSLAGGGTCPDADQRLSKYLVGRPLADVDLSVVEKLSCAAGRACFAQIAAVIREQQDMFACGTD